MIKGRTACHTGIDEDNGRNMNLGKNHGNGIQYSNIDIPHKPSVE